MTAVPPDRRRSLPPGGHVALRPMADGTGVRVGVWPAADPARGSILLLNGRADFIEKYAEAIADWTARSIGVMSFDWRGQGGSQGRSADGAGHVASFEPWVADLDSLARAFVTELPSPHRIVAHSMGGHLALRHLLRGGSPCLPVALLSPMMGVGAAGLPPGLIRRMAALAVRIGAGGRYALLQRPPGAWQAHPARSALLTGDPDRFADEHWWLAQQPGWPLGGVTWGWLAAAFDSIATLEAPGALESIANPVLILVGDRERLVSPAAARAAAARLPGASFETVVGARHELLRETDPLRADVMARLDAFAGLAA